MELNQWKKIYISIKIVESSAIWINNLMEFCFLGESWLAAVFCFGRDIYNLIRISLVSSNFLSCINYLNSPSFLKVVVTGCLGFFFVLGSEFDQLFLQPSLSLIRILSIQLYVNRIENTWNNYLIPFYYSYFSYIRNFLYL